MFLIEKIQDYPSQNQRFFIGDGTFFDMSISYRESQQGWFIDELTYQDFTLKGMRIYTNPNILYQFRNLIPFGIACQTIGNQEPTQQGDFASGISKLYLLTQAEVTEIARLYSGA